MENNTCKSEGCPVNRGSSKAIEGIHCDVTNCVYHEKEHQCTASCIQVGPSFASTSDDTACATFMQKKD